MIDLHSYTSREKFILGGAAGAALLALLPLFRLSFAGVDPDMAEFFKDSAADASMNALRCTEGLLAWLGALATLAFVIADRGGFLSAWTKRTRRLAPLLACAVSVVCMLVFMERGGSFSAMGISGGRTVFFYASFAAMAFALFHAFQRWTAVTVVSVDASADTKIARSLQTTAV